MTHAARPVPVLSPAPSHAARVIAAARQRQTVDVVEFAFLDFQCHRQGFNLKSHPVEIVASPPAARRSGGRLQVRKRRRAAGHDTRIPRRPRPNRAERLSSELPLRCDHRSATAPSSCKGGRQRVGAILRTHIKKTLESLWLPCYCFATAFASSVS